MKKLVDLSGPDIQAGTPRKGPTCDERVRHARAIFGVSIGVVQGGLPPEPREDRSVVRGVQWDPSHNTVGSRHATGSRDALDYSPAETFRRAPKRDARLAPRALARAKRGEDPRPCARPLAPTIQRGRSPPPTRGATVAPLPPSEDRDALRGILLDEVGGNPDLARSAVRDALRGVPLPPVDPANPDPAAVRAARIRAAAIRLLAAR